MTTTTVISKSIQSGFPIQEVVTRLASVHTWDLLGNFEDPLDELVYIVLSTRTRGVSFQVAYERLKRRYPSWDLLSRGRASVIEKLLRPFGLSRKKTTWLKSILLEIRRREGKCDLQHLRELGDQQAEEYLTSLPGVGLKTARCVLMYSLGRSVFPVDANVWRILERLEVIPARVHYQRIHDLAQARIPPNLRLELHVYSVIHGRDTCLPRAPRCASCCLRDMCPYPRRAQLDLRNQSERT